MRMYLQNFFLFLIVCEVSVTKREEPDLRFERNCWVDKHLSCQSRLQDCMPVSAAPVSRMQQKSILND